MGQRRSVPSSYGSSKLPQNHFSPVLGGQVLIYELCAYNSLFLYYLQLTP